MLIETPHSAVGVINVGKVEAIGQKLQSKAFNTGGYKESRIVKTAGLLCHGSPKGLKSCRLKTHSPFFFIFTFRVAIN